MPEQITLTYTNGTKDTVDAMIYGGAALGKKYRDWPFFILSLLVVVLCICGGAFIGLALWIYLFDQKQNGLWLIPPLAMLALFIYRHMFKRMAYTQALTIVRTRFGSLPQTLEFDDTGATQTNAVSTWHTQWAGVENVVKTPHGLGITISGIVVPIPDAAFDSKDAKKAVLSQLTQWHKAAQ